MSAIVGVDLGQFNDYTALAVVESVPGNDGPVHSVRHLDRWRGKPYTDLTGALAGVLAALPAGKERPALAVDQTGVGVAVVDQLRAAKLPAELVPISIHGGDKVNRDAGGYRVPKRDLVGAVAVTLQANRLRIAPALPLVSVLTEELARFKVKIDPNTAHDSYAAWREADHDDMVLAVAMAVWLGERRTHRPVKSAAPEMYAPSVWGQEMQKW